MIKFALKGMLARKLRTALTALAIVLGVTMVSGTFVLTDSIDKAFDSIFSSVYQGHGRHDHRRSRPSTSRDGSGTTAPPFDESLLAEVAALPDVAAAIGGVAGEAAADRQGRQGDRLRRCAEPRLQRRPDASPSSTRSPSRRARGPATDEVVIDVSTASKKDLSVGDPIGVQAEGPVEQFKISGLVKFGSVDTIGGATLAGFDLADGAAALPARSGSSTRSAVAASRASRQRQLVAEINDDPAAGHAGAHRRRSRPPRTRRTPNEFISFLRYFLLAFGVIALFVGAFVIFNSLSITIAQRTRELATLRTLGASRRQVRFSVIVEALVMGTLASIVGLFLGLALATGLFKLFDAVGFTLPNSGLLFSTRTIIVSLLLGIIVTLIASILPGASRRRACRRSRPCARERRSPRAGSPASGRRSLR